MTEVKQRDGEILSKEEQLMLDRHVGADPELNAALVQRVIGKELNENLSLLSKVLNPIVLRSFILFVDS